MVRKSLSIVKLQSVTKSHDQVILNQVDLEILEGSLVVITGPSGSGKSTLLQILGLLEPMTSGNYHLNGVDVDTLTTSDKARLRNEMMGFVFQRYHLVSHLTVLENILLPLQYSTKPLPFNDKALSYLKTFGLLDKANMHPHQLSYGEMQRVAIIRAIISEPKIILADEPTGALDEENSQIILKTLRDLNQLGYTVILITHDESLIQNTDQHLRIHNKNVELVCKD